MLFKLFLLSQLGIVSFSSEPNVFNCKYDLVYEMHPGKESVVTSALVQKQEVFRNEGGSKKTKFEFNSKDRPVRATYLENLDGESECFKKAKNSCAIVRKGIIQKKVVTASFEGRALKEFTCKEGEKVQERILPIAESKQKPVAAPAPKTETSGAR